MTSKLTREELLNIIDTDHVQCGEASALARMALAAMDGEPVAWLLSGGGAKNVVCFDSGNAYADPLREVTPLYADPRPAPTSAEPFAYIIQDKYERERGVEGHLSRSHVSKYVSQDDISEHEITCTPLYRHAQQPVVPEDVLDALQKVARIRLDLNDFDGDRRGIADCLGDAEEALIEVVNRRAAMLNGGKS